jgi:uncharacterized protein YecE (DUF72 family)
MQLFVGTSGYSYKEWKGPFYPKTLPDKEMLPYYSANLPAVEINNTFYRMPAETVLAAWAEQVPSAFRFVLKAPRKITHAKPLRDKAMEVGYLFRTAATLGDKLGAVLFQLPPYLHRDTALLSDFLDLLPSPEKTVFEFRHLSWFDDTVYGLLRRKACALCCSDSENEALGRLTATAGWGYLRLRKPGYSDAELSHWLRKIKSQHWQEVYAFFKHEDAGAGPRLARQFIALAAKDLARP